ncbi:hypothetical protein HOLleu_11690 [Holothuria leucospilota]|uniref:CUB domain-containing protein n=1 Tax=Holothuria leucospilota TaxID=206669 RepID=A0A9Q1CGF6_HOLLE|nr:hypothetical protein HOLleu_11690 [Holothuria leucospilota]
MSKNFPSNYPNDHRREIIFWTFDSHRVLLNFDFISTEAGYDFVKVGNGNTTDEQVLLTWSGGPAENKTKVLSSGNTMWFFFETDRDETRIGFSGVVRALPASESNFPGVVPLSHRSTFPGARTKQLLEKRIVLLRLRRRMHLHKNSDNTRVANLPYISL